MMFTTLLVLTLGLCCCSKASSQSSLGEPRLYGPSGALVGEVVELNCEVLIYPNETVLLQLFKKGEKDEFWGDYSSWHGDIGTFLFVIRPEHEGNLQCVARAQNNTNIEPTFSNIHYLRVLEPVREAKIEVRSGPVEFFEGSTLELLCKLTAGNHVSYKWLLNNRLISDSHHELLVINRTTSKNSGNYSCVASNSFNRTLAYTNTSSEVQITVKDLVSTPDISFSVLKEGSHTYSAVVTCHSTKGTPPVTFSLYNSTELIANMTVDETTATFKVPLVLDQHLGLLQCTATNGNEIAHSAQIPLEVVAVGGPVVMQFNYYFGENYAVNIVEVYCKVAKGSYPQYQWFLNNTRLDDLSNFYVVYDHHPQQSILVLDVNWSLTGTYHCEASDSFDNTTAISSKKRFLDKEALNRLPVLVVAVVFGCFTFLVLLVSICCGIGVVYRRRQYGDKSLLDLKMRRMAAMYEGEPSSLSEYEEDADVLAMTRGGEFDQVSEASVDDWPYTEEEEKTLEDEGLEEL